MSPLQTLTLREVRLPSGPSLSSLQLPFTLSSPPSPGGENVIVLLPSMTGEPEPGDWWPGLVRTGGVLDPDRWALLTPALPGGAIFPSAPDHPSFSIRDMAHLVSRLAEALDIPGVRLVAGGSVGGMVALEWAASHPLPTGSVVAMAAPAARTAHALGVNRLQRLALSLGGPREGLALARELAMLTYRSPAGLEARFGDRRDPAGDFLVHGWLRHHGHRLVERFPAEAYRRLLDAMDGHDVGAGRGGAGPALRAFPGTLLGVGIEGDLLYPPEAVRNWTEASGAHYREIRSLHGHDAFLLEEDQVGAILEAALHPAPIPCTLPFPT